ncbi:MAG TPA: hypothetical protein PKL30_19245 [Leptospiraceae bacterium]|jgi:hypothetical protein|nr:hypothetical protein [Leptospiraceae bacterium]HNA09517.1 hypothetical protein [Leptospiraceae bacterium]HNF57458.1 hypothetical protein [Leptospiraceae bacterium]HNH57869.1 hypothetical protein [Leptospiraceae bacterium]HNM92194.1 hypothetical protein [Leptospiraceae bacterium]
MATIQDFLQFDSTEIPVEKNFVIEGNEYKFLMQYNEQGDFYTLTIKDLNDDILITNKLTYLSPVNDSVIEGLNIASKIIPVNYDNPDSEVEVNKANFGQISIMLAVE